MRRNPNRWEDWIDGEWWLLRNGTIVEASHAHYATVLTFENKKAQILAAASLSLQSPHHPDRKNPDRFRDSCRRLRELSLSDKATGTDAFYVFGYDILDEFKSMILGDADTYEDYLHGMTRAFCKHEGAVQAISSAGCRRFGAWSVTEHVMKLIRDFLESDEFTVSPCTEIGIEQYSRHKYASLKIREFMVLRKPSELWGMYTS